MAKTHVQQLVTNLCIRLGWSTTASASRADALVALNAEEQRISQPFSMQYLAVLTTIELFLGEDSIAAPTSPAIDFGKTIVISGLRYEPVDRFFEVYDDSYGDWNSTKPGYFTIANTTTDPPVPTIYFAPANGTGLTLTYSIIYQRIVAQLTDSSSSYSVLPEGYENTLLIDMAEAELKRQKREPDAQILLDRVAERLSSFYESYRMTKEQAMTDREQSDRKVAIEKLASGA